MYIIQCLLYCMSACKGERALAPQLLGICVSLGFCVPNRRDPSVPLSILLSVESLMHLKCCICFTETEKNPFSSSIVFAQSLTCVFSLFQVNLKIHLTLHREQTEKCFLEGKTKSFDADFFPLKEP